MSGELNSILQNIKQEVGDLLSGEGKEDLPALHEDYDTMAFSSRYDDLVSWGLIIILFGYILVPPLIGLYMGPFQFGIFIALFMAYAFLSIFVGKLMALQRTAQTSYLHGSIRFPFGAPTMTQFKMKHNMHKVPMLNVKFAKEDGSKILPDADATILKAAINESSLEPWLYTDKNISCLLILPSHYQRTFNFRDGRTFELGQIIEAKVARATFYWVGRSVVIDDDTLEPRGCDILFCVECDYFAETNYPESFPKAEEIKSLKTALDSSQALVLAAENVELKRRNNTLMQMVYNSKRRYDVDVAHEVSEITDSFGDTTNTTMLETKTIQWIIIIVLLFAVGLMLGGRLG